MRVCLTENAFNAFLEVFGRVVYRRDYGHERLVSIHIFRFPKGWQSGIAIRTATG